MSWRLVCSSSRQWELSSPLGGGSGAVREGVGCAHRLPRAGAVSAYFRLAAEDIAFGDGTGSPSIGGVGGSGLRGASLAPDENVAASHLLGGQSALEPQVEGTRADRRKQREVTKQRRAAAVQERQQLRTWKQARAHTGGSVEGSSGKVAKMGNNGKKGKTNLHSKTHGSKEFYDSGDDKRDECADAPGKMCSSGRADEKRIFVEHKRVVHAVELWNARGVEARVVLRIEASQTNLYSHVQSMKELAPEALSRSGRSNSFAGSPMFTMSASLTVTSCSSIPRCHQGPVRDRRPGLVCQARGEPNVSGSNLANLGSRAVTLI